LFMFLFVSFALACFLLLFVSLPWLVVLCVVQSPSA